MRYTEYHAGKAVIKDKNKLSEAMEKLARLEDAEDTNVLSRWIPISERLPEEEEYILLSFANYTGLDIGRYEKDGENDNFYPGDEEETYASYGLIVNAWMPLPDSYMNEFVLGRKRIMVPISMARRQMEADGISSPTFDPDDTVYYLLPEDKNGNNQLTEVDMSIRAQEHELGIQKSLDLLSLKVGMGAGRYKYDSGGVKTATEVISDKSDLYQNRQKHCIVIADVIINMVRAVSFLDTGGAIDATVDFDDSIIEDSNSLIDKNVKLVNAGLRSKLTAIMEINKCSEQEAQEELERIRQDNQITGQDIDWTGGDDDELDEEDDSPEEKEGEKNQDPDDSKSSKTPVPGDKE